MTITTTTDRAASRFIEISMEKAAKLYESGFSDQSIALYSDILCMYPDNHEVRFNLARVYRNSGRDEEAISLLRNIPQQSCFYPDALFQCGMILVSRRDFTGGVDCFTRILELNDNQIESHNNLALCLMELSRLEEAYRHFSRAIELAPGKAETFNNLGNLFARCWRLGESREQYQRAIALKPDYAEAYNNLGRIANFEGRLADAVELYRTALKLRPSYRAAADNLLFALNYADTYSPEQVRDEHLRLAYVYNGYGAANTSPLLRQRRQDNKIRVGYVSADFKSHSVGFFIEPVLNSHNKDDFNIFCYDQAAVPDATTARLMKSGWAWRTVYGLTDSEMADQVRADAIDILVDLSGHSDGNRMGVFAQRPAPVQVTWLGYPNTTGLMQIDYRFTDELADPPGMTDHLYSESLVRLPRSFLCYGPPASAPEVALLPGGPLTFCCFNNFPKISETVLRLWARILHAVPDSKLLLKSGPLGDPEVRSRLAGRFADLGIEQSRLVLVGFALSREEHLRRYGACHVALDTYPYNGTTTTCEALWMGVPVVTMAGPTHASRVGVSLLENAGLPELIAQNTDQYVNVAVTLANAPERLLNYRHSLREQLSRSQLMDATAFTAGLEQAYRRMFDRQRV
jgi:predicted O-linked N-acetylglucosamine transferase (SPINDLY family)